MTDLLAEIIQIDLKDIYLRHERTQLKAMLWQVRYGLPPPPEQDSIFNKENPLMSSNKMKVVIETTNLLAILKKNMIKHVENFDKAVERYRAQAMKALQKRAAEFETSPGDKLPDLGFRLPTPISYEKDYTRAIAMLTMHKGDTIELGQDLFSRFIEDEWDWSRQYEVSTLGYVGEDG